MIGALIFVRKLFGACWSKEQLHYLDDAPMSSKGEAKPACSPPPSSQHVAPIARRPFTGQGGAPSQAVVV